MGNNLCQSNICSPCFTDCDPSVQQNSAVYRRHRPNQPSSILTNTDDPGALQAHLGDVHVINSKKRKINNLIDDCNGPIVHHQEGINLMNGTTATLNSQQKIVLSMISQDQLQQAIKQHGNDKVLLELHIKQSQQNSESNNCSYDGAKRQTYQCGQQTQQSQSSNSQVLIGESLEGLNALKSSQDRSMNQMHQSHQLHQSAMNSTLDDSSSNASSGFALIQKKLRIDNAESSCDVQSSHKTDIQTPNRFSQTMSSSQRQLKRNDQSYHLDQTARDVTNQSISQVNESYDSRYTSNSDMNESFNTYQRTNRNQNNVQFNSTGSNTSREVRNPQQPQGGVKAYSQNLIIFDWDDTLFCTTAFNPRTNDDIENLKKEQGQYLAKLDGKVSQLLNLALESGGQTVIVTNAVRQWIYICAQQLMPKTFQVLKTQYTRLPVISARADFESKLGSDRVADWKVYSFLSFLGPRASSLVNFDQNQDCFTHIIIIGDSTHEMRAGYSLSQQLPNSVLKQIKLRENPAPKDLLKQIGLILQQWPRIIKTSKSFRMKLAKKEESNDTISMSSGKQSSQNTSAYYNSAQDFNSMI